MAEINKLSELQEQLEEVNCQLLQMQGDLAQEIAAREKAEARLQQAMEQVEAAEQASIEREQYYKMLLESTHDVIHSVTPEGIITYLGPQMVLFGYQPEELISKNFIDFVAPEQRQEVVQKFKTGTAAGRVSRRNSNG